MNAPRCRGFACASGLLALALAAAVPARAQAQGAISLSLAGGVAHDAEGLLGTFPLAQLRGALRMNGDFTLFAEAVHGWARAAAPAGCSIPLCDDYLDGGSRFRALHAGVETRVYSWGMESANHLLLSAALGATSIRAPALPDPIRSSAGTFGSLVAGATTDLDIGAPLALRLGASAYLSSAPKQDHLLPSMREILVLHGGLRWRIGA